MPVDSDEIVASIMDNINKRKDQIIIASKDAWGDLRLCLTPDASFQRLSLSIDTKTNRICYDKAYLTQFIVFGDKVFPSFRLDHYVFLWHHHEYQQTGNAHPVLAFDADAHHYANKHNLCLITRPGRT